MNGSIPLALLLFFRKSRFNIKKWVATLIDQAHPLSTGSGLSLVRLGLYCRLDKLKIIPKLRYLNRYLLWFFDN